MNVFALTISHTDRDGDDYQDIIEEVLLAPLVFATFKDADKSALEYLKELYEDVEMDAPTDLEWGPGAKVMSPRIKEWRVFNEETGALLQITELPVLGEPA